MKEIISKLRLDGAGKCSRNIWLSFFAGLLLISMNYRTLVIPLWLIILMLIVIVTFSLASFIAFIYWISVLWNNYSIGDRVQKFLYLMVLGVLNLLNFYILLKVI